MGLNGLNGQLYDGTCVFHGFFNLSRREDVWLLSQNNFLHLFVTNVNFDTYFFGIKQTFN
jgi:hypothetical protein